MRTLLLASALFAGVLVSSAAVPVPDPVPLRAFCRALRQLMSVTPLAIKANHTSLDGLQAENITFTFSRVTAQSTSLGFTSLLDKGLNYCNLYNLLSASGLTSAPGFMEMTNRLATCKA